MLCLSSLDFPVSLRLHNSLRTLLPPKKENRRCQALLQRPDSDLCTYISLPILSPFIPVFPQTCLLPRMKTLYDHPYHLPITNLSYCRASPTRRVAKCRAPHDQLSPWPLEGIQPSAPLLSAMTAQPYRQTVGDETTSTNKPINMIMCHG